MRPGVSWARTSPPRDDVGATVLLYIGQLSLGIHHRNSVITSSAQTLEQVLTAPDAITAMENELTNRESSLLTTYWSESTLSS